MNSGKRKCPSCNGKQGLAQLSQELVLTWAEYEGVTWGVTETGASYWFHCLPCHLERWADGRKVGRYSHCLSHDEHGKTHVWLFCFSPWAGWVKHSAL